MAGFEILVDIGSHGEQLPAAYLAAGCEVEPYRGVTVDKAIAEDVAVYV